MPELPRSSKYVSTPHKALDEEERNRLVARLNEGYSDGVVSEDDYPVHLDTLFSATTLGEVAPVVAALPPVATHDVPALVEAGSGQPGELTPIGAPKPLTQFLLIGVGGVALLLLIAVLLFLLI